MTSRTYLRLLSFAIGVAAIACGGGSGPLQPSGAGSLSFGTPQALQPADGALLGNLDQPVTLVAQNATVNGTAVPTYMFEVASDSGFSSKIQVKDGVAQGSGQTSVRLDTLTAGKDYYWHVRAQSGSTTGSFSSVFKFTVSSVSLSTPVLFTPLNGAEATTRPTLTVTNVARQGPAGPITYQFEIASNAGFNPVSVAATVSEGSQGRTSFTPANDLAASQSYFWRVTAFDQSNNASSAPSPVQGFTTGAKTPQGDLAAQLGVTLWPNSQPPGTTGHAVLGDNWQVQILHHIPTDHFFQSPTLEMLRFFDLFDRGFDPQGAIDWMNGHGYPTRAQWYPPPEKAVLGLEDVYLGARNKVVVNGIWDLILKLE